MAQLTDIQLQAEKEIIKTETIKGANSALRVGQMFEDINDSKANKTDIPEVPENIVTDANYTHINPPSSGLTFVPATGIDLSSGIGTSYNQYPQNGALEIIIATGSIENGCAILPILTDGSTITATGATKWAKSDDASATGIIDIYVFWKTAPTTTNATGIWFNITNPA